MKQPDMIFAVQPAYGHTHPASAKAFWAQAMDPDGPNKDIRVVKDDRGTSLLGEAFDYHWATALNMQSDGYPIKYFVMLHNDIVPQQWWLDQLVRDIEECGADVVSALVPLKDQRGLTSTAIDDPDDEWDVLRRLTLSEAATLPPIFSAADCGYPGNLMLANTGCWICDFTKPWRHAQKPNGELEVSFHIRNAIRINEAMSKELGITVYRTRVASEDWEFSRKVGRMGGKVLVTKRVRLSHMGDSPKPNWDVWGTNKTDTDLSAKFLYPINSRVPIIEGWLSEKEGQLLEQISDGRDVVEIGSYCGLSTVWIARAAKRVLAIDTFESDGTAVEGKKTLDIFKANLVKYGVDGKVEIFEGKSEDFPHRDDRFDVAFIDGSHDEKSLLADLEVAERCLHEDGLIAFHDYRTDKDPDVTKVVNQLVADGYQALHRVDSIVVLKRPINLFKEHTNGRAGKEESRAACGAGA